ncbi:MAG: fasciclin domain-containing protein [Pseudomonadota bacterium]
MPTILDIATSSDDFNILTAAIGFVDTQLPGTDLAGTLAAADANLTVFAPTDAAFGDLADVLGFSGDTADEGQVVNFFTTLDPALLRDVILYHVSPEAKTLAEINSDGVVSTALAGAEITPEGPVLNDLEPDVINPSVAVPDVMASNGIVQVIDKVLLPIDLPGNDAPTITEIVAESGGTFDNNSADFDLLLNAVQAAGLADALNDPNADLTVFAPNDAAFVSLSQTLGFEGSDEGEAFAYIVDALSLLGGGDPIPLLTEILTYHVSGSSLQASHVLSAEAIPTLQGGTLVADGLELVDADPGLANPSLIATDIQAANGIVHVLDGVLQPLETSAIIGAPDTDLEIGGGRSDFFKTGRGNDFVDGNGGADFIRLGKGDDVGFGGNGADVIKGGRGDDLIDGGARRDVLFGGRDNDQISGGDGGDKILGGGGDDVINGGAGRDHLIGGRGSDTFVFAKGNDVDRVFDFKDHQDKIDVSDFGITDFHEIEHLIRGNAHRTVLELGEDKLVLVGTDRHDIDAGDFIFADQGDLVA